MDNLKHFLWNHQMHDLVMGESQRLVIHGVLTEDEAGYILGEEGKEDGEAQAR